MASDGRNYDGTNQEPIGISGPIVPSNLSPVHLSPLGHYYLLSLEKSKDSIVRLSDGEVVMKLNGDFFNTYATWSPDEKYFVALERNDKNLGNWDIVIYNIFQKSIIRYSFGSQEDITNYLNSRYSDFQFFTWSNDSESLYVTNPSGIFKISVTDFKKSTHELSQKISDFNKCRSILYAKTGLLCAVPLSAIGATSDPIPEAVVNLSDPKDALLLINLQTGQYSLISKSVPYDIKPLLYTDDTYAVVRSNIYIDLKSGRWKIIPIPGYEDNFINAGFGNDYLGSYPVQYK
jgi:hypothetical protein